MLQNEVCSLELAQKLKYLGVKQESIHCYYKSTYIQAGKGNSNEVIDGITLTYQLKEHGKSDPAWCGFTVGELGDLLPPRITVTGIKDDKGNPLDDLRVCLQIQRSYVVDPKEGLQCTWLLNYVDEYMIGKELIVNRLFPHNVWDVKEADARAKLLAQLIEAGFVKIDGNRGVDSDT